jgi:hypothetical protein
MESRDRGRLDRGLDQALGEYGNAKPRPGLETRILARLEAETDQVAAPRSRWWALGAAAATAVIAAAVWLGGTLLTGRPRPTKRIR